MLRKRPRVLLVEDELSYLVKAGLTWTKASRGSIKFEIDPGIVAMQRLASPSPLDLGVQSP
jgi:hypothetical protein